ALVAGRGGGLDPERDRVCDDAREIDLLHAPVTVLEPLQARAPAVEPPGDGSDPPLLRVTVRAIELIGLRVAIDEPDGCERDGLAERERDHAPGAVTLHAPGARRVAVGQVGGAVADRVPRRVL